MTWVRPEALLSIPCVWLALAATEWMTERRRARLRTSLGVPEDRVRRGRATWALPATAALLGLALAGPVAKAPESAVGPQPDVVLALDASRSMTVTDVAPSRAELARLAGLRLSSELGGRVGLVVFADQAHVLLPPTLDRDLLRLYLESLDPDVSSGQGSDLARAVHVSLDALESRGGLDRPAAVVLITDGEGFQTEAELDRATSRAKRAGLPVHALVVGTEGGGPVPGVMGARSVARPGELERLARRTEGRWADVRDGGAMDVVARALAKPMPFTGEETTAATEILVLLSLWLVIFHSWWTRRAAA